MWSKNDNKEYVVYHFDITHFHFKIHRFESLSASGYFRPHSHGEELDFMFEFEFVLKDDHVISQFSINY